MNGRGASVRRLDYEVVVVGAGPAGATAARQIARRGASVLLVDKAPFPRPKVCGCCLNHDALATLDRLGLGDLMPRLGARPLHALRLAAGNHATELSMPKGAAVSRCALDAALAEAARDAGAVFLDRTQASLAPSSSSLDPHHLSLRRASEQSRVTTGVLIAADGLGGRLLEAHPSFHTRVHPRARLGLGAIIDSAEAGYEPGVIHMASEPRGYVGLVAIEGGMLDIAAAVDPDYVKEAGGAAEAVSAILRARGWPVPDALRACQWRGTPLLTRRRRPLAHDGIFLLGDTAGYVEPFTGEGIAWALGAGEAVADPAIAAARHGWDPALARRWRHWHRRMIARPQARCQLITALLRRPRVVRAVMSGLHLRPSAAQPVIRALTAARLADIPRASSG